MQPCRLQPQVRDQFLLESYCRSDRQLSRFADNERVRSTYGEDFAHAGPLESHRTVLSKGENLLATTGRAERVQQARAAHFTLGDDKPVYGLVS